MSTSTASAIVAANTNGSAAPASASTTKNLLARAKNYENLTAWERTILKALRYCVVVGVIAGLQVIGQALTSGTVDGIQVLKAAAATGGTAALLALVKYLKARNQVQLSDSTPVTGRTAGPVEPKVAIGTRQA